MDRCNSRTIKKLVKLHEDLGREILVLTRKYEEGSMIPHMESTAQEAYEQEIEYLGKLQARVQMIIGLAVKELETEE